MHGLIRLGAGPFLSWLICMTAAGYAVAQPSDQPRSLPAGDNMMEWPNPIRSEIKPHSSAVLVAPDRLSHAGETQTWSLLRQDMTLYKAFLRWSSEANWQLVWDAERDFPIESDVRFSGNLIGVVSDALETLKHTDYPLQAVVNVQQRVIRIVRHSNTRNR